MEKKHKTRKIGHNAREEYERKAVAAFNKEERATQFAINNEIFRKGKEKKERLAWRDKGVV